MNDGSDTKKVTTGFLPVDSDWLTRRIEPVLEPDLPILDPHHHLFLTDTSGHRYLLSEYLEDIANNHLLIASVFVECREFYRCYGPQGYRSLGETEFANGVAAMSASGKLGTPRVCAGIIGNVDLRLGDSAGSVLESHIAVAGGRFCGIRNVSAWHNDIIATTSRPPPGLLLDTEFRRGFAWLARLGLTFDAWLLHTQLDELVDLARSFPDTAIVCDHIGGPIGIGPYAGKRSEVFTQWSASIRKLASCPNVNIKLGGMGMRVMGFNFHARRLPPSSQELADAWRPYIEFCIESFGPHRAMFESNFPVDKGSFSWTVMWNAFKRISAGASADEKRALFLKTASQVYRFDLAAHGIMI